MSEINPSQPFSESDSPQVAKQKALLAVVTKIWESLELENIFQSTAREVRQLLDADRVGIYRFKPESAWQEGEFVSEDVQPPYSSILGLKISDHCFAEKHGIYYQQGRIWVVDDFDSLNLTDCLHSIVEKLGFKANLVVSLLKGNELWGLLTIHQCSQPRHWEREEIEFVQQIAQHLSMAIEQATLLVQQKQQVAKAVEREKAVAVIIDRVRRSLDIKTIFQTATEEIRQLLQVDRVGIYRFNPDWSGEFMIDSVGEGWTSLVEKQREYPKIVDNISDCAIKYLPNPHIADTYLQNHQGGFPSTEFCRVCDDIYQGNFSSCYLKALESYEARAYIMVAIYQREKLWGLLATYQNSGSRHWQETEINFLIQVGVHLGVALQQAELFAQIKQRKEELQTALTRELQKRAEELAKEAEKERSLAIVIDKIRQTLDLNTIFQTAAIEVKKLLGVERITIYQFDEEYGGEFIFESTAEALPPLVGIRWSDDALQATQGGRFRDNLPYIVDDIGQAFDYFQSYGSVLESFEIKSLAVIPLFQGEKLWGLLTASQHSSPRQWQTDEIKLLQQIAAQLSIALKQTEYVRQIRDYAEKQAIIVQQERALSQVIDKIRRTLDLNTIFQTTVTEVRQLLQADRVAIFQFEPESNCGIGEFIFEDVLEGFNSALATKIEDHYFSENYASYYQKGKVLAVNDITQSELFDCHLAMLNSFQIKAKLISPLVKGKELWGLLCIHQCSSTRHWQCSEIEFVSKIAVNFGVALQQAELLDNAHKRTAELQVALAQVQSQKENLSQVAAEEKALGKVIERIRQTLELETIFNATTEEVRQILNCDRVVVYRFFEDWNGEFCYESIAEGWESLMWHPEKQVIWNDTYLQENEGGRYRYHENFAVDNINTAGLTDCHIEILADFHVQAFVIVPVFVGDKLWGLLGAYQHTNSRHWQEREINLLAQVGNQLGVSVYQSKLLSKTQQQSQELQTTLADLNAIVDNLADGLLVTDIQGIITRFNPALQAMFDLKNIDLKGKKLADIFPQKLAELVETTDRENKKVVTAEVELEQGKAGQALATSIIKNAHNDEGEQCLGSVILIRDVTTEREIDRMKTDFLATVSHELKTPLTSILGFASIIKDKLEEVIFPAVYVKNSRIEKSLKQVLHNLVIIVSEAERLTNLINDVLDIAKMESGIVEWHLKPTNPAEILELAITASSPLFATKELSLIKEFETNLPEIIFDQDRLIQVIINLISNAIKFTESGSIICRAKVDHNHILISVTDTGIGIAEDDLSMVFERFKQVGNVLTDKPEGTGLGLAICKQIVEYHRGKIWVESKLGEGSTFYFTIPIITDQNNSNHDHEQENLDSR